MMICPSVSHRNAAEIVDTVFETLKNTLVNGESIKLVQFGTLNVREKTPLLEPKTIRTYLFDKRAVVIFLKGDA